MPRTVKSTDQLLAEALTALQAPASNEKTVEEKQRDEALEYVRKELAQTLSNLEVDKYTGEARDLIGKAAGNLTSALRNATQAVKKQADPSTLAGVVTQDDTAEATEAE